MMKTRMEEMKKAGMFDNNKVVGYLETEVTTIGGMKWFKGGKF